MKIHLINPPFLPRFSRESRSPAVAKSGTLYFPMWLAYATGVLEQNHFDVKLIDAPARDYNVEYINDLIKTEKPELVVLDTSTPSIVNDISVAEQIKKTQKDTFVVMVGRHVSALPNETLNQSTSIDAVARGEYDYIIRDLAITLRDSLDLAKVKGLTWRNDKNELVTNEPADPIENIDELSFVSKVYKKHLNIRDYFYGHSKYPIISLVSGRGCPHHCFYCCYPQTMFGHKLRLRSPENLAAEFLYIKENFPDIKEIMFEDDTLTANIDHVNEVADRLIANNNKIEFSANSRAELTDILTLKKLRKAGCRLFCVGFESGSQQILDNMNKGLKLETAIEFSKATKKAGIMVHGCFMVGTPGETKQTLSKTLKYAQKLNPDTAQFYPLMVYPGTKAFEWAKEKGYLLTTDYSKWLDHEGLHATIIERPDLSSKELINFCNRARKEFYLRPAYIFRKFLQSLTDWSELKRNAKGFKSLLKFLLRRNNNE